MINKVILMGRLTSDPEHKQTQNGVSFTRFSIAIQRSYADKNTGNREADFINIIAWRQQADFICRFFNKGKMIIIEGSIQTGSYEDKNTGAKRTSFEVVADQVTFGESKSDSNNRGNNSNFAPPERNNSYQNNSNQGNSYQGNSYQGNSNQGNSYQGNDYQDNNYQGNPNQGNNYQEVSYNDNSNNGNSYQNANNGASYQNDNNNSKPNDSGFSVGEFFEATDDDEDDFPY